MDANRFNRTASLLKREYDARLSGFGLHLGFGLISSVVAVRILSVILSIIGIISIVREVGTVAT
ncbi:MAG: hypothetical protein K1Y36_21040 [Blastocatellia bacterium]|nr:hypothetical protein [Blastocatellia bacterium]